MKLTDPHKLYIEFAIGCALRVLPKFEEKYKDDMRPRRALEAARTFLNKPTKYNKKAAAAATDAAAAGATDAAAGAAAWAAAAAGAAAWAAAAGATDAAAGAAAWAAAAGAAAWAAEGRWQVGFLAYLNFKYSLNVKVKGVE